MPEKSDAPSPVIRYFLPGLVLGAVLGGTLATIVPEFASAPGSRLDTAGERPPSMQYEDSEADREVDHSTRDLREQVGDAVDDAKDSIDNAVEDGMDSIDGVIDDAGDAVQDGVDGVIDGDGRDGGGA